MGRLILSTLGMPEARHGGEVLQFRTRKSLALLIYLAVERGLHSRAQLTALFWPESDEERGRTMLRRTLAFLRQTLGEATASPGSAHLVVERDALGFNTQSDFSLDVHILDDATHALPTGAGSQRSPSAAANIQASQTGISSPAGSSMERLQMAASAYRGDFLEGFALEDAPLFDDWAGQQREYWHTRAALVFDKLSQSQSDVGASEEAKNTLSRWLALDPLSEKAYVRLIRLHLAAGDKDAAMRAYQACRSKLASELGAEPSPEIEALAERIRLQTTARPDASEKRDATSTPPLTLLEAALVGRGTEFTRLVELYHLAYRGNVQVAIIDGEAGIGKTRLATDFLGWAGSREANVLPGRAFEASGRIPYQPLVAALRHGVERENAPDDLLADVWLSELSRLLPELRDRYPDLPEPASDEAVARTRLFEAVTRLGQALAERTPLVLSLDDLQWADTASLDMLQYSLRRWSESGLRVMVLCTLRSEALTESQTLSAWLGGLGRDLPVTRISLDPLTPKDTLRWVESLAPPPGHSATGQRPGSERETQQLQELGEWLFRQTNGQPFYIAETLKALLERGVLSPYFVAGQGWSIILATGGTSGYEELRRMGVPSGVHEMIRVRLAALTPVAFSLVCAGAVLGQNFTFEQLCQVASVGENDAISAVDLVLRHRLWRDSSLQGSASGAYSFVFTHDNIRDVAYTEAGEPRRRIFHRRALEVLQEASAPPAELARHAVAAGLPAQGFRFNLQAGDNAMRLFAVRDALSYYLSAYGVIREAPTSLAAQLGITIDEVRTLYSMMGKAHETLNEWSAAEIIYGELLALARQLHQADIECLALNRLSMVAAQGSFDLRKAAALLQEAQQLAEQSGDKAMQVETEWNLSQLSFYMWNLKGAVAYGERALALIDEKKERELYARCLNTIAYSKMMMGRDWSQVEELALRVRTLFTDLGNRTMEADSLSMISIINVNGGMYDKGLAAGREGFTMARDAENPWGQANCAWTIARALLERGHIEEALDAARQGVDAARLAGHPPSILFNLAMLGRVHGTLFGAEQALPFHLEAGKISEALGHPLLNDWLSSELCMDSALAGDWKQACSYALRAVQGRDYGTVYAGPARWYETEALLRGGETERAAEDVLHFGEQCDAVAYGRRYSVQHLHARATLVRWGGNLKETVTYLEEAAALAAEIGMVLELWQINALLGELYRQLGQPGEADAAYRQASKILSSIAGGIRDERLRTAFLVSNNVDSYISSLAQPR